MNKTVKKKKGSGGKLSRSETVTVRLDPKLRYLAGLAARQHRRTLSSFIEWAIKESLDKVSLKSNNLSNNKSIADEAINLWDVDEPDRFIKLAFNNPDLLTHDEQVLWKLIQENGHLWHGYYDSNGKWKWQISRETINYKALREDWESLKL